MEDITENAWSGNPISDAACGEYLHKVAEPSREIAMKQGPGEYNMYLPSKSKVNTICGDLITPHTYEPGLLKLVVQPQCRVCSPNMCLMNKDRHWM